jgi:hypothetical protein
MRSRPFFCSQASAFYCARLRPLGGALPMNGAGKIPINTLVMAPLGDVLYRGIVVAPRADQSLAEGIVCVAFIPPVTTAEPLASGRSPMQPSLRYGHHPALARPSGRSLAGMAGRHPGAGPPISRRLSTSSNLSTVALSPVLISVQQLRQRLHRLRPALRLLRRSAGADSAPQSAALVPSPCDAPDTRRPAPLASVHGSPRGFGPGNRARYPVT